MPAKKTSTKKSSAPNRGVLPPYGPPIKEAIARGDVAEMRKLAATTRKWLKDVTAAYEQLEKALSKK